jgi:hypothetical protein
MIRLWCVAVMLVASVAAAQPAPPSTGADRTVTMEPTELDTIGCLFRSWTLTAPGTVGVSIIGPPVQADSAPSSIISAGPTRDQNTISVQISPDAGCGTSGCRDGNSYQVRLTPEAGTDRPTCNFRVTVRTEGFR